MTPLHYLSDNNTPLAFWQLRFYFIHFSSLLLLTQSFRTQTSSRVVLRPTACSAVMRVEWGDGLDYGYIMEGGHASCSVCCAFDE